MLRLWLSQATCFEMSSSLVFANFEPGALSAVSRSRVDCEEVSFYFLESVIPLMPLYLILLAFIAALNPSSNK